MGDSTRFCRIDLNVLGFLDEATLRRMREKALKQGGEGLAPDHTVLNLSIYNPLQETGGSYGRDETNSAPLSEGWGEKP